MGYIIKLHHRRDTKKIYVGAVPVATGHDDAEVAAFEQKGARVYDFTNTFFETLEEASEFPYPAAEVAAGVICTFPETKNIEYEVIAVGHDHDESMNGETQN